MDPNIKTKLLEINNTFYEQFAGSFSSSRHQVQPGVRRLIQQMKFAGSILDIGCGNGTLARALTEQGFSGCYLGVDMSESLLAKAEELLGTPANGVYKFSCVDLSEPGWASSIPTAPYDWLVSFAVLHHMPGQNLRQQAVQDFANLISTGCKVAVSVWQWQNSPRLRKRVLPWSVVGLNPEVLDDGDVLLDWRAGETPGLRYVHTFSEGSLSALAESAGFRVIETLYSDGKSGNLALYQVWQLR